MIKRLYAIFDKATKGYLPPFTSDTEQEAIRQFSMSVNHEGGFINQFPGDYSLAYLGTFSTEKGILHPEKAPEFTIEGVKLLRSSPIETIDENIKPNGAAKVQAYANNNGVAPE